MISKEKKNCHIVTNQLTAKETDRPLYASLFQTIFTNFVTNTDQGMPGIQTETITLQSHIVKKRLKLVTVLNLVPSIQGNLNQNWIDSLIDSAINSSNIIYNRFNLLNDPFHNMLNYPFHRCIFV